MQSNGIRGRQLQAKGFLLRQLLRDKKKKKTQYFIAHKPCSATNHNYLVRLLGLLEVPPCLQIAAKYVLALQTSPKIFRAFKENTMVKTKTIAKDEQPSLTVLTSPVP